MLLCGAEQGHAELAADLAALLSERDPLNTQQADLQQRLEWLHGRSGQGSLTRVRKLAQQYRALCKDVRATSSTTLSAQAAPGYLIACAYPDRIARQRDNQTGQYRLSQGRGARLSEQDRLSRHPWLAVASLTSRQDSATDQIRLAAALDPALFEGPLAELKYGKQVVEWDTRQDRLIAEQRSCIGQLILARKPVRQPDPERRTAALLARVRQAGLQLLPLDDTAEQLRLRLAFVRRVDPEPERWPDLSDTALLDSLEDWLAPWLDAINKGSDFARLDMSSILRSRLDWPLQQALDQLAPERLQVPSGSRIRVDYSQTPPVLAVKLQEMFGCTDTPTLGFNTPVTLHLLSPAQRPLQVTQDLAGFWRGSYHEVRKEMKGRYPKHPWPEDPTCAVATARTKRAAEHKP